MKTSEVVVIITAILGISSADPYQDYQYPQNYQQTAQGYQPPFMPQPNSEGYQPPFDQLQHQRKAAKKFKSIEITPELEKMVHHGLRMVNYDPNNVELQKASAGRNMFRISYLNPALHNQRCYFQFSYCNVCQISINPLQPVCSSPCPGGACKVDYSLSVMSAKDFDHQKHWQSTKYDESTKYRERDYRGLEENNYKRPYNSPYNNYPWM